MDASPEQARIKGFLILFASLLLTVLLGFMIGSEDYMTLFFGTIIVLAGCLWLFSGYYFWLLTIASSFLGGTFPFLRGSFTPFQILLMMGLVKFLFEDVVLRRRARLNVDRIDVILIAAFMTILTVHGIPDRFGMKFLGSSVWGGRNYVNVYVGLIAFFVIQSMPMKAKLWNKLPYLILAVTGFDLGIAIVTTIFPSAIFKIYPFYSAVSQAGIEELFTGAAGSGGRIGAFGNFGVILSLLVLASVSVRQILHPANFAKLLTAGVGAIFVLFSGFRSAVLQLLLGYVAAAIRDLKAAAILLLPALAAGLFILSVVNSELISLPLPIQRGLTFVPGHWEHEMARDAAASNDFRLRVWTLWWEDYFPKQPLLGRGFGFKSEMAKRLVIHPNAIDFPQMVETGNIHNGFFASLDAIGLVGTVFFAIWVLRLLVLSLRTPFRRDDPAAFAARFLALYIAVTAIAFWGGAATIGSFLPQFFAIAGVFLRLRREYKPIRKVYVPPVAGPELDRRRQLVPA